MRIVEGIIGRVSTRMTLSLRPDYASITPWLEPVPDGVIAAAGPDAFRLTTTVREHPPTINTAALASSAHHDLGNQLPMRWVACGR